MRLTEEEKAILDSVERGEWQSVPDLEAEKERYKEAARATKRKDKHESLYTIPCEQERQ
ncbi:MAG TPA: hypothetical protein PLO37_23575 [Candidatus Hydrogenedentes bacterium]|nr:hypothetical protein [Candidatus Hydrogenedentota bacterium]HPG69841.1 hypothetical protein [Candidatus Hydrogenedentota bacterium]